ncbi:MAG: FecR/PupR family sigma factor regulator [Pararobbsia sp.]
MRHPRPRPEALAAPIIDAAIAWAVKIEFGTPGPDTRDAFDRWLNASPLHARAWRRVQSLRDDFTVVPPKLALDTLQNAGRNTPRTRTPAAVDPRKQLESDM